MTLVRVALAKTLVASNTARPGISGALAALAAAALDLLAKDVLVPSARLATIGGSALAVLADLGSRSRRRSGSGGGLAGCAGGARLHDGGEGGAFAGGGCGLHGGGGACGVLDGAAAAAAGLDGGGGAGGVAG